MCHNALELLVFVLGNKQHHNMASILLHAKGLVEEINYRKWKKECNPISQEGVQQNTCAQQVVASTPCSERTHRLSALHSAQPVYLASVRELSYRRTVEGSQMPHQFSVQLYFSSKKHFSVSLFPLFLFPFSSPGAASSFAISFTKAYNT